MNAVDELDATIKGWRTAARTLALGSLVLVAALSWQPLALLIDTMLHWPNIAMGLIPVALVACAAGVCVLITTVALGHKPAVIRRFAIAQYSVAAVIAAVSLVMFFAAGQRYEMPPSEYLNQNLASSWLLPLLLRAARVDPGVVGGSHALFEPLSTTPSFTKHARTVTLIAMDDTVTLLEIEAIKQLKARYCRLLDTKDWQAWRDLFSDDFLSDTSQAGGKVIRGADEFVAFTRKGLRNQATVHQVHAPEIELTSPTTARGVWALEDVVRFGPGVNLRGYGHYTETYEKVDGQWLFTSSTLTRLREDMFNGLVAVYISDRIRRVVGNVSRRVMK